MKKTLMVVVALMLVVVLTFGLFACNNKNKPVDNNGTDNTGTGTGDNNGDNKGNNQSQDVIDYNVGEEKYEEPKAGDLTTEDVNEVVLPVVEKIVGTFDSEEMDAETKELIGNIVTLIINKSGVDKAFLAKYMGVVDNLWEKTLAPKLAPLFEGEADLLEVLEAVATADTIQTALTTVGTMLGELDANQLVSLTCAIADVAGNDVYEENNYNEAAVKAELTALGVDESILQSASVMSLEAAIKSDEVFYLINVGLAMVRNLSSYSAAEISEAAQLAGKVIEVVQKDGIPALLSSEDVSFGDMVKVVNTVGKLLNSMLKAVGNYEQLGVAINGVVDRLAADAPKAALDKIKLLTSHPELLGTVANLLSNVTAEDVTTIYTNIDDWQKKQRTENEQVAFVELLASVVDFVKPEYDKLSVKAKTDISTFLGNATLYRDVDELISLIPADRTNMTQEQLKAISDKVGVIMGKVNLDFGETESTKAYILQTRDDIAPFVVAAETIKKDAFVDLLKGLGYYWAVNENAEAADMELSAIRDDHIGFKELTYDLDKIDFDFAVQNIEGVKYAVLSGEDVETAYVELRANSDNLVVTEGDIGNTIRVAKGSTAEEVKADLLNDINTHFGLYDKSSTLAYRFYDTLTASDITFSGLDIAKTGKQLTLVNVSTVYGVCKTLRYVIVYDSAALQVESIGGYYTHVAIGTSEADLREKLEVYANYDDGSRQDVTAYTITGFTAEARGDYNLTVTFEGKSTVIRYHVYDPAALQVDNISASCNNSRINLGDAVDSLGLYVTVEYDDGSYKQLTASDYTVEGFSSTEEGRFTLKVVYGGKKAKCTYYVLDYSHAEVNSIMVWESHDVNVGDDVSALNIQLRVYYNGDYSARTITEGFTVEGFDSTTTGNYKSATISYGGQTTTLWYNVYDNQ